MRLLRAIVLALALLACAGGARAQDKTSHNYSLTIGHVVTLGWTASPTPNVTYNVYVSGTSGGPYTRIGNTAALQFDDLNAIAGNTYFYVVTAVNADGESVFSPEASATVPVP